MTGPGDQDDYTPRSGRRIGGNPVPGRADNPAPIPVSAPGPSSSVASRFDSRGITRSRFRKRSWLILIAAAPLVFAAFRELAGGNAIGMGTDLALYALYAFSVFLIRQGGEAEDAYLDRTYASPPGLPRKLLGSLGLGAATALTGLFGWDIGFVQSLGMGILAAGASVLTFGLDPMRAKGEVSLSGVTPQMVEEAIEEAEERLQGIDRAAADIADRPLRDRLGKLTARGRDILRRIEDDPSDLRRARKFLKVYLEGALEATRKYVRSQHDLGDSETYLKFRSLLDDMLTTFDRQHEKLLTNDRMDLDVEIDVLAERLDRETVPR